RLHMPNILPTPISLPPDSKPGRYSGRGDVDCLKRPLDFFSGTASCLQDGSNKGTKNIKARHGISENLVTQTSVEIYPSIKNSNQ
ncbi:hypothetical protein, partial [Xanthomonas arboricola]|uniref:hypothetical protein n=1 Tax=Xanthomonas arboricola TaxID=56448 RepID=UPI003D1896EC